MDKVMNKICGVLLVPNCLIIAWVMLSVIDVWDGNTWQYNFFNFL